eukprot:jgi/Hompol1/4572/HPOL_003713-RA
MSDQQQQQQPQQQQQQHGPIAPLRYRVLETHADGCEPETPQDLPPFTSGLVELDTALQREREHASLASPIQTPTTPTTPPPTAPSATVTVTATAAATAAILQQQSAPPRQKQDKHTANYIFKSMLAGGLAGCAAKTVIAPLDRVKILFQTSNPVYEQYTGSLIGASRAMRKIIKTQGSWGLFQGHSATLLRIFPYAAIKFMAYEQIKAKMMPTKRDETSFRKFLAGSLAGKQCYSSLSVQRIDRCTDTMRMMAVLIFTLLLLLLFATGCTSVFFSYPLDILRVRLAFETRIAKSITLRETAQAIYNEPNVFFPNPPKAFKPIVSVLNFYRGFMPTFYGMIPYAGVSFLTYETLKTFVSTHFVMYTLTNGEAVAKELEETHQHHLQQMQVPGYDPHKDPNYNQHPNTKPILTAWANLAIGSVSGVVAQTCSYPLEVVRRRMQVSARSAEGSNHVTTLQTINDIWKRRGFKGFWVGLGIGYIKVVPMFAVSFYAYEFLKTSLNID